MRILYLAPFTSLADHFDSGVVGYGQTAGSALVRELRRLGHTVEVTPQRQEGTTKAEHAAQTYVELTRLNLKSFDALFMYNTFHQFAAELRRFMYETGASDTMLAGYTHGSHWDPSDEVRHDYPLLKYADLGNVLAFDRVFLVSHYMLQVMTGTIATELGTRTADDFAARAAVVGSTIDIERLDAAHTERQATSGIVFNHSPTRAKRPEVFFRSVPTVLADWPDATVTVTRRFCADDPGFVELQALARDFPDRLHLGDTMPIDDYLRLLWRSRLQVSTATHESFGVSTVEAIYAGCCAVLPTYGCYAEIAGGAGIYAEGQLVEAMHRVLSDPAEQDRTARLQRLAVRRYYPARVAARIAAALAGQPDPDPLPAPTTNEDRSAATA